MNIPWKGSLGGFTKASKTDSWTVKEKRAGTGNDITNHVREAKLGGWQLLTGVCV